MDTLDQILKKALLAAIKLRNLVHFLLVVARGLGVSTLARISRARSFAACKVHWTLHLSGSANRGDFSRIMQLEIVDSHNAPPIACSLLLRLFRFGFNFVFWVEVCL
ncbi:hypothetical protein [Gardnerella vaginalis]|uniref:hypothetical protein n=1 Tax=Gardnerella vaginalis TaxID=2702 RepID=UPI000C9C9C55|nr:hypothetical protein [Gardnerella vaginalis]PMC49147.1 hypothetical protein CJ212_06775 [Gardnerella vaginalis]